MRESENKEIDFQILKKRIWDFIDVFEPSKKETPE